MGNNATIITSEENFFIKEISKFLGKEDFDVSVVSPDKFVATKADGADIFLIDVNDPDGNAGQVCQHVLNNPSTSTIPTVAFVPQSPKSIKLEIFRFGVDEVFEKPVDLDLLVERIKNLFSRKEKWSRAGHSTSFEKCFSNMHSPALLSDNSFTIVAANKEALNTFGEDIIGKSVLDIYPESAQKQIHDKMAQSGHIPHFQADLSVNNGGVKRYVIGVERYGSEEGADQGFLKVFFNPLICTA